MTHTTSARSPELRPTPENEALLLRMYAEIPEAGAFLDEIAHRMDPGIDAMAAPEVHESDQSASVNHKAEAVVADLSVARHLRDARDSVEDAFDVAA